MIKKFIIIFSLLLSFTTECRADPMLVIPRPDMNCRDWVYNDRAIVDQMPYNIFIPFYSRKRGFDKNHGLRLGAQYYSDGSFPLSDGKAYRFMGFIGYEFRF